ncbi:PREDICTED: adseverin-like [Acropora digitifera]|uniref:adseverin-like n=1 Tax=Acropora digitifera TaxID=70779 RepID=UPI00077AC77D|nr:PREDICTED: adseverin-like [Acropora digitifera]
MKLGPRHSYLSCWTMNWVDFPFSTVRLESMRMGLSFRYFQKASSMYTGGHASGFKEGKKKFEKRLFQVKGKRNAYASQVPLSISSLNQGDCFVLDSGRKLFVWIGKESNKKERFTACRFAQERRDEERAGLASVSFIETTEEEEDFFFHLTGNRRIVPITKEGDSDEKHEAVLSLNLYRSGDSDQLSHVTNVNY